MSTPVFVMLLDPLLLTEKETSTVPPALTDVGDTETSNTAIFAELSCSSIENVPLWSYTAPEAARTIFML